MNRAGSYIATCRSKITELAIFLLLPLDCDPNIHLNVVHTINPHVLDHLIPYR